MSDGVLRTWYRSEVYRAKTMRAPRKDQLGWVLRGYRAGVRAVYIDPEDYAGLVQRLGAAGALTVDGMKACLELGGIDLGGFGPVRRFEFVAKDARLRTEEDREEEIRVAEELQAEWEAFWREQERTGARR